MKPIIVVFTLITMILSTVSVYANQAAVIPAYSFVSAFKSSMQEYQDLMDKQNRAAARKLLNSEKVFLSPRDVRVEIVMVEKDIAQVKMDRLDENAKLITLYFWTLSNQLKFLPKD
jgi:hypothetical protein